MNLTDQSKFFVKQVRELAELIGYETRNKYQILDGQSRLVGFAAEQQKGIWGFLMRQFLGHWRTFEIHIFNSQRQKILTARHPFCIFFQRLEIFDSSGRPLGALQQRFSILRKLFDVLSDRGMHIMQMRTPIISFWTFPFFQRGRKVAQVSKKWSGALSEVFTDRDNFLVEYYVPQLTEGERQLILAAAIFIDLQYFEKKANR